MNRSITKISKYFIGIVLAGVLLLPMSLRAQTGGFAGTATRIGYNARGMAMSNAMTAVTSEGTYAYYNPAQAGLKTEIRQVDLSAGVLPFDRILQTAGASFQLPPTAGLLFSIIRAGVKDIDGRTQSGYPTGLFDASEYQLNGAFGIRLSSKFHTGIGLKFGLASYHKDLPNATSVGIDLGFLIKTDSPLNIALAAQDIFANYSWNSQELYNLNQTRNVVNNYPTRLKLGLAWQTDQFTISSDAELQVYTSETISREVIIIEGRPQVIEETNSITTSTALFRAGGSWKAHERFTLRAGGQLSDATNPESWGLSSGFSVHLPFDILSPSVDYAFVMEPYRISSIHVFSVRLNL